MFHSIGNQDVLRYDREFEEILIKLTMPDQVSEQEQLTASWFVAAELPKSIV